MKAILVIDMPNNCKVCPQIVRKGCYRKEERPIRCPLKPLPRRAQADNDIAKGWNWCLDEIIGETE